MSAGTDARVEVLRDLVVTTVPAGAPARLPAGSLVRIVHGLGGSVTVAIESGVLVRVNGEDRDALGLEPAERNVVLAASHAPFHMDRVTEALQSVYDPEIPVSIVELGLVYRCEEVELPDGRRRIEIDMSMTAPGCGMGDVLRADAAKAVGAVAGVDEVAVELVFDPPWSLDRMSEAARLEVGLF